MHGALWNAVLTLLRYTIGVLPMSSVTLLAILGGGLACGASATGASSTAAVDWHLVSPRLA